MLFWREARQQTDLEERGRAVALPTCARCDTEESCEQHPEVRARRVFRGWHIHGLMERTAVCAVQSLLSLGPVDALGFAFAHRAGTNVYTLLRRQLILEVMIALIDVEWPVGQAAPEGPGRSTAVPAWEWGGSSNTLH